MKKLLIVFFLFFVLVSINGQEYNLLNGIILTDENKSASMTLVFNNESDIKSGFDRGKVIRYSNNENNLGKFVEIEYELGFTFEGTFISNGIMIIIFSNLKEIYVTEDTILSQGNLIGKTKKGVGNDLRVFLFSIEDLPILRMWTNNKKLKLGDYWAWDPSFLFRK
jgi:hypothetical protein